MKRYGMKLIDLIERQVGSIGLEGEIHEASERGWSRHAVGDLTLRGHNLKVAADFLEHEGRIDAFQRDRDERGAGCEVPEREAGAFAHGLAVLVLNDVSAGTGFDVTVAACLPTPINIGLLPELRYQPMP